MQRYLLTGLLCLMILPVLAGCPSSSDDGADTKLTADAGMADGGASADSSLNDGAQAKASKSQSGMKTGRVVQDMFKQRAAIEAEIEALAAAPQPATDVIEKLKQEVAAINAKILELAEFDREAVLAELEKLMDENAIIAKDWRRMITDPAAAPIIPEGIDDLPLAGSAGEIALSGSAYSGQAKPIEQLRKELSQIWKVEFSTTFGNFTLEVYPELAPIHAVRFLELVEAGYYDNLHISRITPDWVQWGDLSDLSNVKQMSPGQQPPIYPQYKGRLELVKPLKDEPAMFPTTAWTVCFAKDDDKPNSASAQPFINLVDNTSLGQQHYSAFGYITEGRDNILALVAAFEPVMEAARARLRDEMTAAGKNPLEIEMLLRDDKTWYMYVEGWDPFRDALIKDAQIVKRP